VDDACGTRDGAERTLLTAISAGTAPGEVARLLLEAVSDRYYCRRRPRAQTSSTRDSSCSDHIGWEHASAVLPTLVGPLVEARGAEESDSWRHPADLIPLCEGGVRRVAKRCSKLECQRKGSGTSTAALADALLGDEPGAIIAELKERSA
jgi:hypothetical protein